MQLEMGLGFRLRLWGSTAWCATCTASTVKHHNGLQAFHDVYAKERLEEKSTDFFCPNKEKQV